jgi:hypothetical protein
MTSIHISLAEVAVFGLVFLAIVGGAFLLPRLFRGGARGKPCRWSRDRSGPPSSLVKWRCRSCAAEAYSTGRRPPQECKKALRSGL